MTRPREHSSDVAFTPAIKAIQARKGSRHGYERMERRGGWETIIDSALAAFIERQISVFLGTASRDGQPYIQYRGGPPGFLRVLDEHTVEAVLAERDVRIAALEAEVARLRRTPTDDPSSENA